MPALVNPPGDSALRRFFWGGEVPPLSPTTGAVAGAGWLIAASWSRAPPGSACAARTVVQNPADPAAAGFVLADRVLTIAQLVELDLPDGRLAMLPGCGTAAGPARLLDEAVHVVATLWSIPDAVGVWQI